MFKKSEPKRGRAAVGRYAAHGFRYYRPIIL